MPKNYDTVDLIYNDDFGFSPTGDILASDVDVNMQSVLGEDGIYLRTYAGIPLILYPIARHILDVCRAYSGDWKYNPKAAANLEDFNSEPNTSRLEDLINKAIATGLAANNLVKLQDLDITVTPVTKKFVLVRLALKVQPTKKNSMTSFVVLNTLYNTALGNVVVLEG